jgi:hypothetical protein
MTRFDFTYREGDRFVTAVFLFVFVFFFSFQLPQLLVIPSHRCIPRRSQLKVSRCCSRRLPWRRSARCILINHAV